MLQENKMEAETTQMVKPGAKANILGHTNNYMTLQNIWTSRLHTISSSDDAIEELEELKKGTHPNDEV